MSFAERLVYPERYDSYTAMAIGGFVFAAIGAGLAIYGYSTRPKQVAGTPQFALYPQYMQVTTRFCPSCGYQLPQPTPHCPMCGKKL